jgi:DNA polymerase-3 subunit gamma/tau
MSYQVLYRRFRPQRFSEVVGQESITTILKNQITTQTISHAYLFAGSKGTGKTSTAKIFARAVNCLNPQDGEPCGVCEYCKAAEQNRLTDIIEIDAASNRGIDEIRDLKDKVNYLPQTGRYRVYIIDEVHMLTTEAFNALLKTLEEPPEHIIFIFATTEPNKILPTILSRCQRFDFARISQADIIKKLYSVLQTLETEADEEALRMIAEHSDGALRDALSHTEKALSVSQNAHITEEDVTRALGLAGSGDIYAIAEAVADENASKALEQLDDALNKGSDINQIISQLIDYFRALMIAVNCENPQQILGDDESLLNSLQRCGKDIPAELLTAYILRLSRIRNDARYLPNPRYLLEAALIALSDKDGLTETISLTARVDRLERKLEQMQHKQLSAQIISKDILPEQQPHTKEESAEPQQEQEKQTKKPVQKNVETLPSTPKEQLTKIQNLIENAAKVIHNQDRDIMMADLFRGMKAAAYDETKQTLYLYPTGSAEYMMDVFEAKQGREKLEHFLQEKLGNPIHIVITNQDNKEAKDLMQMAKDVFGELKEID